MTTRLLNRILVPKRVLHIASQNNQLTRPLPSAALFRWLRNSSGATGTNTIQNNVVVERTTAATIKDGEEKVIKAACGDLEGGDDDDEDEFEEMFVDPHVSLGHQQKEWGGPTRGGRLAEPTRFGDWERKGRCTDF